MADGHVDLNNNTIELTLKDEEHIKKFKNDISSDHKISTRSINEHLYYRICFRDSQIISDLKSYGFYNTKTYSWDIPIIPENLMKYFICGLFDGDGSIRLYNTAGSCCSGLVCYSEKTLYEIKQIICQFTGIDPTHISIKKYGEKIPELRIHSIDANKKFLDWIYKDSDIYLDRKYDKYLEFCRLKAISEKNKKL